MHIAVIGASGRMGRELIRAIADNKKTTLTGALERPNSPALGQDAGMLAQIGTQNVKVTDSYEEAFANAQAVLDFTTPEGTLLCAEYTQKHELIHVIGTTGFTPEQEKKIAEYGQNTSIVKSGNMSLGVNLLAALSKKAAKALPEEFDIEIVEMHHRNKVDAPSGTALLLGEAAATGRAQDLQKNSIYNRHEHKQARKTGQIGFSSMRGGTVVGEHSVIFAGNGERITLSHTAEQRNIFANGALQAALWAENQPNGLYSMFDVLGLSD